MYAKTKSRDRRISFKLPNNYNFLFSHLFVVCTKSINFIQIQQISHISLKFYSHSTNFAYFTRMSFNTSPYLSRRCPIIYFLALTQEEMQKNCSFPFKTHGHFIHFNRPIFQFTLIFNKSIDLFCIQCLNIHANQFKCG